MKISEREFIRRLRAAVQPAAPARHDQLSLVEGIGDDCAVIRLGAPARRPRAPKSAVDLLVTTDLFLENIHFRREWQPPRSVGHKALARGLSDIAAMGGVPRFAFLSLALPKNLPQRWLNDFLSGLLRLAREHGVALAGGDTSAARTTVMADIMVVGEVPAGCAIARAGAAPGDHIFLSGQLGGAAHGLNLLRRGRKASPNLLRRLFYPQPRLEIGRWLRDQALASAMIDLSDGLSIDLARLCEASSVGAELEFDSLPRAGAATDEETLHGGEDHELLFTVPARMSHRLPERLQGIALTRIGRIVASASASPRPFPGTSPRATRSAAAPPASVSASTAKRSSPLTLIRHGERSPLPVRGFEHF